MKVRSTMVAALTLAFMAAAARVSSAHAGRSTTSYGHQAADGKEIYLKNCKECHGVLGAPTKASLRKYDKIPNFTDPEFFKTHTHEKLLESVEKGKGRDMKGFAGKLSAEEIKAVVAYIHTLEKKG